MKKILNLGKILLILLLPLSLFSASVNAKVDKKAIYPGDIVFFTIEAKGGENVVFPEITDIGGFPITGTSSSQSTVIINGNVQKSVSKTYTFSPVKDVTIPSYEVKIDSKVYKTKPIEIKVLNPASNPKNKNSPISLILKTDKKDVYVGEPVRLDIEFRQRVDVKVDKVQIARPKFKDLWVKKIGGEKETIKGDYIIKTYSYMIFPQKSGQITIGPIYAKVGKIVKSNMFNDPFFNDPFFKDPLFKMFNNTMQWKRVFSNTVTLNVKHLPNNLEIFGDYVIKASVDKKKVKANKPVNLTITIAGEGNIDDIKKFDLDIEDAVVYSDEPKISTKIQNGKYVGVFTQKIAIIADKSFTIPPIKFRYFDQKSKKEVVKETKPIFVEVIGGKNKQIRQEQKIKTHKEKNPLLKKSIKNEQISQNRKENNYIKYILFILGYILGIGTVIGFRKIKFIKPKEDTPLSKAIKKAKSDKELFEILLPYAKDEFIKEILKKLEENIYEGKKNKIDKEELIEWAMDI